MPADVATVINRLVPAARYRSARGRTFDEEYADLVRTWFDSRPIPTRQQVEAERAAADSDQLAIEADPVSDEILEALLIAAPNVPAINALRTRRSAADVARGRARQPRGRSLRG